VGAHIPEVPFHRLNFWIADSSGTIAARAAYVSNTRLYGQVAAYRITVNERSELALQSDIPEYPASPFVRENLIPAAYRVSPMGL
jgi:hypothetical protein